eukprot:CAMPEP_0172879970 /NCGR_PEP_ID=MMETSP1075-20121228/113852_1 /TAXON_ID=2916 /ORGANISM="Ceratium fusus, Strain PA161109" /LENGTH=278 /DNA_ID=CAMNT_0013732081 /DNA_START=114 /DNA_END=947 /DNA_ORIENTATION=-
MMVLMLRPAEQAMVLSVDASRTAAIVQPSGNVPNRKRRMLAHCVNSADLPPHHIDFACFLSRLMHALAGAAAYVVTMARRVGIRTAARVKRAPTSHGFSPSLDDFHERHKERMTWIPSLYYKRRAHERLPRPRDWPWAREWQRKIHDKIAALEEANLHPECFIAPSAVIVAEPRKTVEVGRCSFVAANCFVHGRVKLGQYVSVNHGASLDGGPGGITVGDFTRIATGAKLFAWNHGTVPDRFVFEQASTSKGIVIGEDVWICANAGVVDGVTINDHAV